MGSRLVVLQVWAVQGSPRGFRGLKEQGVEVSGLRHAVLDVRAFRLFYSTYVIASYCILYTHLQLYPFADPYNLA